jgi:PTH1 family peptidyl-tRNA hydrolase
MERSRFSSLASEGSIATEHGDVRALLLKPQTFMNESGRADREAARFFKIAPAQVVVFYDEIDMAPGRFRMKTGGGAAGITASAPPSPALGPDFRRAGWAWSSRA